MLRIDVYDASGNKVGDGPLTNIERLTRRRSLDKIGGIEFSPATVDARTAICGAGRRYHIYHRDYGDLGTYIHASQGLSASGKPTTTIKADDSLIDLVHKNCYFRRGFSYVAVDVVVNALIALVSGWSAGAIQAGIGNTTVSYEGESVFEALDVLRDRWGKHFRLGMNDKTLDFGDFGDDSGIRLIKPEATPREIWNNDDVALITALEITEESEQVINRWIPVGGGQGTVQLTLEHATEAVSGYPVKTGINADGSSFYYIEDMDSITNYGLVERTVNRSDISPISNSDADLENAANALYQAALAMLLRYNGTRTHYEVSATKLDVTKLRPGDKVRVTYRGVATFRGRPYKWVDIDELLWVMDIEETYNADGGQSVKLTVATAAERRTSDSDVLASLLRDVEVQKLHVQPNLAYSPVGPYTKRIDSSHSAKFTVRIGVEVTALNYAKVRFATAPLRASATGASSGGGSTQTSGASSSTTTASGGGSTQTSSSGGGGTHTTTATSHQHSTLVLGAGPYDAVTFDGSNLYSDTAGTFKTSLSGSHDHQVTIPTHTHSVSIPSHTHSMAHTHTVTIPAHSHTLSYGLYEDSTYPQNIGIVVDGIDLTTALGGPWAASNVSAEEELDITTYLVNASGGLRQNHSVEFYCTVGQGEIEFECDMLVSVQAIAVA